MTKKSRQDKNIPTNNNKHLVELFYYLKVLKKKDVIMSLAIEENKELN